MARRRSIGSHSRYVAIKYSVPVRDLGSTVEEAMSKVTRQVKLPTGYHIDWAGEYESQKRSSKRLMIVLPVTILVICLILYTMFQDFKWVMLILANVAMAPIGGLVALFDHAYALQRFLGGGLFWRYSASRCRPASSCWSTSTSCARGAKRS